MREQIDVPVREQLIVELYLHLNAAADGDGVPKEVHSATITRKARTTMLVIHHGRSPDEGDDTRQQFAIGPLEPGFGHTLGNSLLPHPAVVDPRSGRYFGSLR